MHLYSRSPRNHSTRKAWAVFAAAAVLAASLVLAEATLVDVAVYWTGGRAVFTGGDVYGFMIDGHGFTYPPFAALVMGTVAWLPMPVMWCCLNLGSLLALATVLRLSAAPDFAEMRRGDPRAARRLSVFLLAVPVTETFRFGQIDLALAALVLTDLLVHKRGVLIGVAAALKLTPAVFVLFLIVRRRYREAGVAACVFAATVASTAVVLPAASKQYWFHNVAAGTGTGGFDGARNQSLNGLAIRILGEHDSALIWPALVVPVLFAGLAVARGAARRGWDLLAAGTVGATGCLVSPLSWNHHWVWVIPAIAGLESADFPGTERLRRWTGFVSIVLVAWTLAPTGLQTSPLFRTVGTGFIPLAIITLTWATYRASDPALRSSRE